MYNVIVTGAAGFIGNYLVEELLKKQIKVFAVIGIGEKHFLRIPENENLIIVEYKFGDYSLIEQNLPDLKYDACINLAWQGVAGEQRGECFVQLGNVQSTAKLMELLAKKGCKRFLGISSVSEFECDEFVIKNGYRAQNRQMYAVAKRASHLFNKVFANELGVDYINVNLANIYGEYGNDKLIVHDTIIKLLTGIKTSFSSGEQYYDFLYVRDVAKGLIAIADRGQANTAYYLGSNAPMQLKEYLYIIGAKTTSSSDINLGHNNAVGTSLPKEYFYDEKVSKDTGFLPAYAFDETIERLVIYYKTHLKKEN